MPVDESAIGSSSLAPSKPFSISISSKSKAKPGKPAPTFNSPSSLSSATKKRPHAALQDPESDAEDRNTPNGRHEAVVGFGVDGKTIGVSDASNTKQPLVIKSEKNQDWRGELRRRRGKNLLPADVQAQQQQSSNGQAESAESVERSEVSAEGGLKIAQPRKAEADEDVVMEGTQTSGEVTSDVKQMTADEEAIAALLGGERKKATLTIPSAEDKAAVEATNGHSLDDIDAYTDEADRFRADVDSRPPPASLADYAAVPVEEFGAAILRGLGWKDGEAIDKRGQTAAASREVKRRPALLGIGAKETPGGVPAEELGAWNQKNKGRRKDKVAFNPVMLKNSVTGEMVTEEEMELRKLEAKQGKGKGNTGKEGDWRERRKLESSNGSEKMQRLAIENGHKTAEESSSRRDRDGERDHKRERRRERDDDNDDDASRRERRVRSKERSKYLSTRQDEGRPSHREKRRDDVEHHRDRHGRDKGSHRRDDDRDDGRANGRHDRHRDYDRQRDYDRYDQHREQKRR